MLNSCLLVLKIRNIIRNAISFVFVGLLFGSFTHHAANTVKLFVGFRTGSPEIICSGNAGKLILPSNFPMGLDTAKAVLGTPKEQLLKGTDLEEETIDEVLKVLAAEFEE